MFYRTLILLAALTAGHVSAAQEVSLAELEGVWAVDCHQAPSPGNIHARWDRAAPGLVVYRFSYTETWPPAGLVVGQPVLTAEGWLRMSLGIGEARPIWTVTLAREGAKVRVMKTVTGTGQVLVEGGTVLQSHTPTRPLERCASSDPVS